MSIQKAVSSGCGRNRGRTDQWLGWWGMRHALGTLAGGTAQLATGIDFDSPDNLPVDLLFILVVPAQATDEHLQLLGRVAALFNDADTRTALRQARTGRELIACVSAFERNDAGG